jgi:predicted acyltransferase
MYMSTSSSSPGTERLLSLDFFRGATMFLLIAEFTHLFSLLYDPALEGSVLHAIAAQFHHHPWNGLRFWDLIQPYFMFIVGVAMPYSLSNRLKRGQSRKQITRHAIQRAILLLVLGWALYCIGPGKIVFRFQNVLAQLAVTYMLAYLFMHKPARVQIVFSVVLLAATEVIYRGFWVEGFNHPFTPNENFGTWLDLQYGGADLNGHWVSFNAIPTTAHTIWGVVAGQLLMSDRNKSRKLRILLIAGILGVLAGYALNPVTPIIKRISTSSFVLVSGGWTFLTLAFSFWLIDMRKKQKWSLFFRVVGMNPLFIYLFAHVGGAVFIESILHPFTFFLFGWMGTLTASILTSLLVLFFLWYICQWLHKHKIYIRI